MNFKVQDRGTKDRKSRRHAFLKQKFMVTELQTKLYRDAVLHLLMKYRQGIYADSGFKKFPSNHDLAQRLGLSDTALSSIFRGCASMSGITLRSLLVDLSHMYSESDFLRIVGNFLLD